MPFLVIFLCLHIFMSKMYFDLELIHNHILSEPIKSLFWKKIFKGNWDLGQDDSSRGNEKWLDLEYNSQVD